jgi:hypothetical protein
LNDLNREVYGGAEAVTESDSTSVEHTRTGEGSEPPVGDVGDTPPP